MIESISYRATRQLPKAIATSEEHVPQIVGINEILVKLSSLPSEPLTCETMLIIELNKTNIDVPKITGLIIRMDNVVTERFILLGEEIVVTQDLQLAQDFVKQLQAYLTQVPSVWDKYNKDMIFSIKVSRYYQQLELLLQARPLAS